MSQKLKVVTIGGGSSYTPELLEGFLKRYHELPVSELWLVDVEEGQEKLDIIHALCQRMVEKAGVPMKVYKTLDRRAALQGADFVTTQLRVGQLKARELDERIPLSHGYLGQETNGAGGLFKGLRTIPVIFDIVKDVQTFLAQRVQALEAAGIASNRIVLDPGFGFGKTAGQILGQRLHVGAAKYHGKHRQLCALEVKAGALGAGRFNRHGWDQRTSGAL